MWKKNNDYIEKKHSAIVTPPTNAKAAGDNNSKSRWQQQQKLFGPKRIMISLCGRQKDLAHCFVAPIVLLNLSWRESLYPCTGGTWDYFRRYCSDRWTMRPIVFQFQYIFEHQWTVMCHWIITANWWTIIYQCNIAYYCNMRLVRWFAVIVQYNI